MALFDQIVAGVLTSVISALILEYIREVRSRGVQPLEKLAKLIAKALEAAGKAIWLLINWIRSLIER
jgi:hypothetical protein